VARSLDEILNAFTRLVEEHDAVAEDDGGDRGGNFRCVGCEGCANCRFCTACTDCDDCTYCDACVQCHGCTQSRQCHGCVEISHSSFSAACQRSSYLVLCYDCEDCVHCFACTGLSGEEFCVLNERVPRKEYFSLVSRLKAELDVRSTEGWRPPWDEDEDEAEDETEPEHVTSSLPNVAAFDDAWLDDLDDPPPPTGIEPEMPMPPAEASAAARAPLPSQTSTPSHHEVASEREEKPTRPYAVVEPSRGPSLRAARRPARRSAKG
jgi:hypothetical protein